MKKAYMADHKQYAELKAKHDTLQKELRVIIAGGGSEELRRRANLAEASIDLEAEALLDPKKAAAAEQARQEAQALRDAAQNADRRVKILRAAIKKLEPDLSETKEKAAGKVIAVIRPQHTAVALKIVELQRQLNAALEMEQEICRFLLYEVGSDIAVVPIYRMMGYANRWQKVQPGREDDQTSTFHRIITRLRENGYPV